MTEQCKRRGVTMVEMLVAVTVTVALLMITGVVFKHSSEASGKASAHNHIMTQLRAITDQIDRDFAGFRTDMPFVVVFENYNDLNDPSGSLTDPDWADPHFQRQQRFVHCDRIVFFADGDFTSLVPDINSDPVRARTARIFYGQSQEPRLTSGWNTADPDEIREFRRAPKRRILTRRVKLQTHDDWYYVHTDFTNSNTMTYHPLDTYWSAAAHLDQDHAIEYDLEPLDFTPASFWNSTTQLGNPLVSLTAGNYYLEHFLFDTADTPLSWIRRPNLQYQGTYDYDLKKQEMFVCADVTDFRVQLWFDTGAYANEWTPKDDDLNQLPFFDSTTDGMMGCIWGVDDFPPPGEPYYIAGNSDANGWGNQIRWYAGMEQAGDEAILPVAIKFTFTLFDPDRRYYPEGKTFSYIVKLPRK